MQELKPSHDRREYICINVDKVYDWIVKELTFDISPTGPIRFPGITPSVNFTGAVVTCKVTPAAHKPIVIMSREDRTFTIGGSRVCLQHLNVQKNFNVTIIVTLPNGAVFTSEKIPVTRCEQVTLCAPNGTDVEITYTDLDCFVCTTGTLTPGVDQITFSALSITVAVCQSIQSTFPVTVEFLANYCEPRADLPTSCSPAGRPKQCHGLFPSPPC
ncbi:hypothetical protein CSE16_06070 [Solibacillus sp. R5-41]|uniref:hypothetical protein n=1 Tax=Solibacillus sp. R5-41 TaxID=2048654 RepID=UPI000C1285AB|nr:hypothetical protein [Solibacillus sp. R5-41]ATP39651.1 hypothetical protein CSE16_06070 [Solibacillus sp. R5-41]